MRASYRVTNKGQLHFTEKPPAELTPAIRALLQPAGVGKAVAGSATLDMWWVQSLGGVSWSGVESGTLAGAMRVTGAFKEIRGKVVAPGVYTLRYGQQPQNGDHLGISTYRDFLLLSPASVDTDPKVLGFDGVVALSKQVIGTSHPPRSASIHRKTRPAPCCPPIRTTRDTTASCSKSPASLVEPSSSV